MCREPHSWTAQDEVLRALVYPTETAVRVAELANKIQSLDSEYRNQRVHLNRQILALEEAEAASAADAATVSQYNSTKTRARAARERVASIAENLALADAERVNVRSSLERAKLRHEEIRRASGSGQPPAAPSAADLPATSRCSSRWSRSTR